MSSAPVSWLSPLAETRISEVSGNGTFAVAPIPEGKLVVTWGGNVVTIEQYWQELSQAERDLCLQVGARHLYLTAPEDAGDGDFINHRCRPNLGLLGTVQLVAMRDIAVGEELCFDYAMTAAFPPDVAALEMDCLCGDAECRGKVTSDDWKRPELQERYSGHFAPHVQRLIDAVAGHGR